MGSKVDLGLEQHRELTTKQGQQGLAVPCVPPRAGLGVIVEALGATMDRVYRRGEDERRGGGNHKPGRREACKVGK